MWFDTVKRILSIKKNMYLISLNDSILYQRGIYPSDDFDVTTKYGMNTVVTNNPELKQYIDKIIKQIESMMIR